MPEYADPVIDWLDSTRTIVAKRYFRQVSFKRYYFTPHLFFHAIIKIYPLFDTIESTWVWSRSKLLGCQYSAIISCSSIAYIIVLDNSRVHVFRGLLPRI